MIASLAIGIGVNAAVFSWIQRSSLLVMAVLWFGRRMLTDWLKALHGVH